MFWSERDGSDSPGGTVKRLRVMTDGPEGPAVEIAGADAPVREFAVARYPGGHAVVTTEFHRAFDRDQPTSTLLLRLFRDDGTPHGAPVLVTPAGAFGHNARIVWTGRRFVVAWETTWTGPAAAPPTFRSFDIEGGALTPATGIRGADGVMDLALVDVEGGAALVWHGEGDPTTRRYSYSYALIRDDNRVAGPMTSASRPGETAITQNFDLARTSDALVFVDVAYDWRSRSNEDFFRVLPVQGCR